MGRVAFELRADTDGQVRHTRRAVTPRGDTELAGTWAPVDGHNFTAFGFSSAQSYRLQSGQHFGVLMRGVHW